jgi:membrane complex biogenesis BtpA family protein
MWNREIFADLVSPPVVGMIHLPPLPGSPGWDGVWSAVEAAALAEADALAEGGAGGIMVENYHDVPFHPDEVPPVTVAALTAVLGALRRRHPRLPAGVNVLRNDARAALSIAAVTGAAFVRINVHAGSALTDQGLVHGRAHETLRLRRALGVAVGLLADVRVKHARPLAERPLAEEAGDLRRRGLADGLILTGPATGAPASPADLAAVRSALPDCPLLAGSGLTAGNVAAFAGVADGFIVGTSLKREPGAAPPAIDPARVAAFVAAFQAARADRGKERA